MFRIMKRSFILLAAVAAAQLASPANAQEVGHLHHVHMNVGSIEETTEFYQRIFGVIPIKYNDKMPALMVGQSFLFLNQMDRSKITNHQLTGLTHVSWSGVDGPREYQWMLDQGVEFYTPVEQLTPDSTYMYLYGPDHEVIEQFDFQRHHRYNHIHLVAEDFVATAEWFRALINLDPSKVGNLGTDYVRNLDIDHIAFSILKIGARFTPRENDGTTHKTDGSNLDHIAFSFRDLDAAYERIKGMGVEIVRPMSVDEDYGFKHFFVRAPNKVLVELVEANPWPEAAWEK